MVADEFPDIEKQPETDADLPPSTQLNGARRLGFGMSGVVFGVTSAWFLSDAQQGNPILGIVLGEVGLLFGLSSLLMFIGAIFAPPWFPCALVWIERKLILGRTLLFLLPVGLLVYVVVVCPIVLLLKWLGVL